MARENIQVRVGTGGSLRNAIRQDARRAEVELARRPVNLSLNTKGFRQPLGRITSDVSEFNKSMDASVARVLAFGASMAVMNSATQALKTMTEAAVRVEKALADINVIFNLTSQNLTKFSDSLYDVARNTASTFDTVATAAQEFARQGLGAEESLRRINDALILNRLSGLGAAQSVSALTAAVNSFAKTGITTSEVINRLANVDASFAVSSSDLANSLQRAGAAAQGAKVEFNELLAVTTSVQQQTARGGSVIGNAFKSIFTRLQRSRVRETLEELGVATENSMGGLRSGIDVLKDYAKIYEDLSDQQRAYTDQQIAGLFQINNLKALLGDLTSDYSIYDRALKVANSSTNQANKRNEELNNTLSALLSQTGASIDELAAKMGKIGLTEGLSDFVQMVKGVVDFLNGALGEEGGSSVAKNLVRGIGTFLTGPGLVIIGAAIAKIFVMVGKFGLGAMKEILGLNVETKRQETLQRAITSVLRENDALMDQITAAAGNTAKQAQILLGFIKQETAERMKQEAIVKRIAASSALAGVGAGPMGFTPAGTTRSKGIGRKTLGMSGGFVPSPVERAAEVSGMIKNKYPSHAIKNPKVKKIRIHDGQGSSQMATVNGHEKIRVERNPATGHKGTFVEPHPFSAAAKIHQKKLKLMERSAGFVPNFNKKGKVKEFRSGQLNATNLVTMITPHGGSAQLTGTALGPDGKNWVVKFNKIGPNKQAKGGTDRRLADLAKSRIDGASRSAIPILDPQFSGRNIRKVSDVEAAATKGRIFESAAAAIMKAPSFGHDTATFDFIGGQRGQKGGVFDWRTMLGDARTGVQGKDKNKMAEKTLRFLFSGKKGFSEEYIKPLTDEQKKQGMDKAARDIYNQASKDAQKVHWEDREKQRGFSKSDPLGQDSRYRGKNPQGGILGSALKKLGRFRSGGYIPNFFGPGGMLGASPSNMDIHHLGESGKYGLSASTGALITDVSSKDGKNFWRALEALGQGSAGPQGLGVSREFNLKGYDEGAFKKWTQTDGTAKRIIKQLKLDSNFSVKGTSFKGDLFELYTAKKMAVDPSYGSPLKGQGYKQILTQHELPFDVHRGGRIGEAKALDVLSDSKQRANILNKTMFSSSNTGLFDSSSRVIAPGVGDSQSVKINGDLAKAMKNSPFGGSVQSLGGGFFAKRGDIKSFARGALDQWKQARQARIVSRAHLGFDGFKGMVKGKGTISTGRAKARIGAGVGALRRIGFSGGVTPNFFPLVRPMNPPKFLEEMAKKIKAAGGNAQIVGGATRDHLLGKKPKDWDVEVFGLEQKELQSLLKKNGKLSGDGLVGKDFGVFKVSNRGQDYDFTMPRREVKSGSGHKGFDIKVDPFMSQVDAAKRRDLTVNAISYDPITKKFIDPLGGIKDLHSKIMRPTSSRFMEDPLRVLRSMQFAGRFGFSADKQLIEYSKKMSNQFSTLPKERVRDEWMKWATKSTEPAKGLQFLKESGWIKHFPEIQKLSAIKQNPKWHPEGNVFEHTKLVTNALAKNKAWQKMGEKSRARTMFSALTHDFGKATHTQMTSKGITSKGHAAAGVEPMKKFLNRIMSRGEASKLSKRIEPYVREHMFHANFPSNLTEKSIRRLSNRLGKNKGTMDEFIPLMEADLAGRGLQPIGSRANAANMQTVKNLTSKLGVKSAPPKMAVNGRDLISAGLMSPGPQMGKVLKILEEAQMKGLFSTTAGGLSYLKQNKSSILSRALSSGYLPNFARPISLDSYFKKEMLGKRFGDLNKMVSNSWQSRMVSGQGLSMAAETGFKNRLFSSIAQTFKGGYVPIGSNPRITAENWAKVPKARKRQLEKQWKDLNLSSPKPSQPVYNSDEQFYRDMIARRSAMSGGVVPNFAASINPKKLSESINAAKTRETLVSGEKAVVEHSKILGGPGVYNVGQKRKYGNIDTTIRKDHLEQGQLRSTLGVTGSGKEKYRGGLSGGIAPIWNVAQRAKNFSKVVKNYVGSSIGIQGVGNQLTTRMNRWLLTGHDRSKKHQMLHSWMVERGLIQRTSSGTGELMSQGINRMTRRDWLEFEKFLVKNRYAHNIDLIGRVAHGGARSLAGESRAGLFSSGYTPSFAIAKKLKEFGRTYGGGYVPNFVRQSKYRNSWGRLVKAEAEARAGYAKEPTVRRMEEINKIRSQLRTLAADPDARPHLRGGDGKDTPRAARGKGMIKGFRAIEGGRAFQPVTADGLKAAAARGVKNLGKGHLAASSTSLVPERAPAPVSSGTQAPVSSGTQAPGPMERAGDARARVASTSGSAPGPLQAPKVKVGPSGGIITPAAPGTAPSSGGVKGGAGPTNYQQSVDKKAVGAGRRQHLADRVRNLKASFASNELKKKSARPANVRLPRSSTRKADRKSARGMIRSGNFGDAGSRQAVTGGETKKTGLTIKSLLKGIRKYTGIGRPGQSSGDSGFRRSGRDKFADKKIIKSTSRETKNALRNSYAAARDEKRSQAAKKTTSLSKAIVRLEKSVKANTKVNTAVAKNSDAGNKQLKKGPSAAALAKARAPGPSSPWAPKMPAERALERYRELRAQGVGGRSAGRQAAAGIKNLPKNWLKAVQSRVHADLKTKAAGGDPKVSRERRAAQLRMGLRSPGDLSKKEARKILARREAGARTQRRNQAFSSKRNAHNRAFQNRPIYERSIYPKTSRPGVKAPRPASPAPAPTQGVEQKIQDTGRLMGVAFMAQMAASMAIPWLEDRKSKEKEGTTGAAKEGAMLGAAKWGQFGMMALLLGGKIGILIAAVVTLTGAVLGWKDGIEEDDEEFEQRKTKESKDVVQRNQKELEKRSNVLQAYSTFNRQRQAGTNARDIELSRKKFLAAANQIGDSGERKRFIEMGKDNASMRDMMEYADALDEKNISNISGENAFAEILKASSFDADFSELKTREGSDKMYMDAGTAMAEGMRGMDEEAIEKFNKGLKSGSDESKNLVNNFKRLRARVESGEATDADVENVALARLDNKEIDRLAKVMRSGGAKGEVFEKTVKRAKEGDRAEDQEAFKRVFMAMVEAGERAQDNQEVSSEDSTAIAGVNLGFENLDEKLKFNSTLFEKYNSIIKRSADAHVSLEHAVKSFAIQSFEKFGKSLNSLQSDVNQFNIDFAKQSGEIGGFESIERKFNEKRRASRAETQIEAKAISAQGDADAQRMHGSMYNRFESFKNRYNQNMSMVSHKAIKAVEGGDGEETETDRKIKQEFYKNNLQATDFSSRRGFTLGSQANDGSLASIIQRETEKATAAPKFDMSAAREAALKRENEINAGIKEEKDKQAIQKKEQIRMRKMTVAAEIAQNRKFETSTGRRHIGTPERKSMRITGTETMSDPDYEMRQSDVLMSRDAVRHGRLASTEEIESGLAEYYKHEAGFHPSKARDQAIAVMKQKGNKLFTSEGGRGPEFWEEVLRQRKLKEEGKLTLADMGIDLETDNVDAIREKFELSRSSAGKSQTGQFMEFPQEIEEEMRRWESRGVVGDRDPMLEKAIWQNRYHEDSGKMLTKEEAGAPVRLDTKKSLDRNAQVQINESMEREARLRNEHEENEKNFVQHSQELWQKQLKEHKNTLEDQKPSLIRDELIKQTHQAQIMGGAELAGMDSDYKDEQRKFAFNQDKQLAELRVQSRINEEQLRVEEEQALKMEALSNLNTLGSKMTSSNDLRKIFASAGVIKQTDKGLMGSLGKNERMAMSAMRADSKKKIADMTGISQLFTKDDRMALAENNVRLYSDALEKGGDKKSADEIKEVWRKTKEQMESGEIAGPFASETERLEDAIRSLTEEIKDGISIRKEESLYGIKAPGSMEDVGGLMDGMAIAREEMQKLNDAALTSERSFNSLNDTLADLNRRIEQISSFDKAFGEIGNRNGLTEEDQLRERARLISDFKLGDTTLMNTEGASVLPSEKSDSVFNRSLRDSLGVNKVLRQPYGSYGGSGTGGPPIPTIDSFGLGFGLGDLPPLPSAPLNRNQPLAPRRWVDAKVARRWTDASESSSTRRWTDASESSGARRWTDASESSDARRWTDASESSDARRWTDASESSDSASVSPRRWRDAAVAQPPLPTDAASLVGATKPMADISSQVQDLSAVFGDNSANFLEAVRILETIKSTGANSVAVDQIKGQVEQIIEGNLNIDIGINQLQPIIEQALGNVKAEILAEVVEMVRRQAEESRGEMGI